MACGDGAPRDGELEAAGRFVVGNCDLLLAVWGGAPARGRGGTAEIVSYAIRVGVPVCRWINANGEAEAKLLRNALDFNLLERAPMNGAAENALDEFMDSVISPPQPTVQAQSGWVGWIAGLIRRGCGPEGGSLEKFLIKTQGAGCQHFGQRRRTPRIRSPDARSLGQGALFDRIGSSQPTRRQEPAGNAISHRLRCVLAWL